MPVRQAKALACLSLALALSARVAAAEPSARVVYPRACAPVSEADFDRAHTLFLSGKQFLDESNYDKAISYFVDSYTVNCNLHEILISIATVLERKGDRAESIRALEEYLARAPGTHDREKIERRIQNLRSTLTSPVAPSAPPLTAAKDATAPATQALEPAKHDEADERPHRSFAPWMLMAAGGLATVTGVTVYAISASDYAKISRSCPSQLCPSSSLADQANSDRTRATIGDVVAGVGVASIAAGVLYWALTPPHESAHENRVSLAPILLPTLKGASACIEF